MAELGFREEFDQHGHPSRHGESSIQFAYNAHGLTFFLFQSWSLEGVITIRYISEEHQHAEIGKHNLSKHRLCLLLDSMKDVGKCNALLPFEYMVWSVYFSFVIFCTRYFTRRPWQIHLSNGYRISEETFPERGCYQNVYIWLFLVNV